MPFRNMEHGIEAIKSGNLEEGARLMRLALKDEKLTGNLRAVAFIWLAETSPAREFKIKCYNDAISADPTSEQAQQRLARLLAPPQQNIPQPPRQIGDTSQLQPPYTPPPGDTGPPGYPYTPQSGDTSQSQSPYTPQSGDTGPLQYPYRQQFSDSQRLQRYPPPKPTDTGMGSAYVPPPTQTESQHLQQQQPYQSPYGTSPQPYNQGIVYRTAGVLGGPNGPGTAFFVTQDGLMATSRYVVGGVENVRIQLDMGRELPGKVVRAFPEFDLAFIRIHLAVSKLLTVTMQPAVTDNVPLLAIAHNHETMKGARRPTKREIEAHWFPTNINRVTDAGGNPIFDDGNYLVGMLSKNSSRSSPYVYGLHISKVFECLQQYVREMQETSNRVYCPTCGYTSQAAAFGAFYCEVCGSTLPFARERPRFPQARTENLYGENVHRPCQNCNSRVGYYNGECLRCGHEI